MTKSQYDSIISLMKKNGRLTTSGVLKVASNPASPLHGFFEWDDGQAANQYRLIQARTLIKRVNIKIEKNEDKIIHVPSKKGEGEYRLALDVVSNVTDFQVAFDEVLSRLKSAEKAMRDLQQVASEKSPEKAAILAIAMKGLETADTALKQLH